MHYKRTFAAAFGAIFRDCSWKYPVFIVLADRRMKYPTCEQMVLSWVPGCHRDTARSVMWTVIPLWPTHMWSQIHHCMGCMDVSKLSWPAFRASLIIIMEYHVWTSLMSPRGKPREKSLSLVCSCGKTRQVIIGIPIWRRFFFTMVTSHSLPPLDLLVNGTEQSWCKLLSWV